MSKRSKNEPLDERQTQERHRLGFQCFMISCVELCIVLVMSMFWYDKISSDFGFYNILMMCLMIPLFYFNIMTKVCAVTNNMECILSIIIAILFVIFIISSIVTGNFSIPNLVFGILFVINGIIAAVSIFINNVANKKDYDEIHGKHTDK